jgi:hypothetical protein
VASTEAKIRQNRLRWIGHIRRIPKDAPIRRIEGWRQDRLDRGRRRPKKIWMELIKRDMSLLDLNV